MDVITPEAINAALEVLRARLTIGSYTKIANFIWEGQTLAERQIGISRLKEADEMENERIRIVVTDAIRAALYKQQ